MTTKLHGWHSCIMEIDWEIGLGRESKYWRSRNRRWRAARLVRMVEVWKLTEADKAVIEPHVKALEKWNMEHDSGMTHFWTSTDSNTNA